MSELNQMQESEMLHTGNYEILRVPGGWGYTRFSELYVSSFFVPHNDEFAAPPIEPAETSTLVDEWNQLDAEHKLFVLRVRSCQGLTSLCEPIASDDGEVIFWELPQELEFIECSGKYSWVITPKYRSLELELMGCKE